MVKEDFIPIRPGITQAPIGCEGHTWAFLFMPLLDFLLLLLRAMAVTWLRRCYAWLAQVALTGLARGSTP